MSAVSLDEVKQHLKIGDGTHDVELQAAVDSAEATVAAIVGPLSPTVVTEYASPCGALLILKSAPAVSLTSVTPYSSTALTLSDLRLDGPSGLVRYVDGRAWDGREHTVVYTAGRGTLPSDLGMAVKELVRHFWATQRGPTRRPGSTPSEAVANTIPGAAYALPIRVSQLIAPHHQPKVA